MTDKYEETFTVTREMVEAEAEHTGDFNPIHLNDEYSRQTRFGHCIAHATIVVSRISKILGMDYPGKGCILISQQFLYKKPIYFGDQISISMKVVDKKDSTCTIQTICKNQNNEDVVDGKSVVLMA